MKPHRMLPLLALSLALPAWAGTPLEVRLQEPALRAIAAAAGQLRAAARPNPRSGDYQDVRCVLHAHSQLSHDSRGTVEQIAAAARKAGVRAVFMTDHPTPDRRWATEGLRGEHDGVLFIPGAELSDGLLVWRGEQAAWTPDMKAAEVLRALQETGGIGFIAHPEQRTKEADWELPPFAGMEIYNSHADAKDSDYEKFLGGVLANPLKALGLFNTLKKYPRESFAGFFDEPTGNLQRWDALNLKLLATGRRVVGIAANDSHQNVGLTVESTDAGLVVRDALGKVVKELGKGAVPAFLFGAKPGSVLLSHQFDPYEISLGYVNTHLLATVVTPEALFEALLAGRAYVAFDWMGDASGFRCFATAAGRTVEMGGEAAAGDRPVITVRANMPCELRLLRNGVEVQRVTGPELTFTAAEPGVYRAEAWVTLGEEQRPWVYGNPLFVR